MGDTPARLVEEFAAVPNHTRHHEEMWYPTYAEAVEAGEQILLFAADKSGTFDTYGHFGYTTSFRVEKRYRLA
jgi:hypothetical protein